MGFLKSVVLQLSPKYSKNNVNLNVKRRTKFNCPYKKQAGRFSPFRANLQSSIRVFLNDFGQIRDVCSFDDIEQPHFPRFTLNAHNF